MIGVIGLVPGLAGLISVHWLGDKVFTVLSCQMIGVIGSVPGLTGLISVHWLGDKVVFTPSISLWQHMKMTEEFFCEIYVHFDGTLTLCRAQCLKTSRRGRGQNVPKRPVAIGKLRCFQTRKFPYNLARISGIITVWDFCYFLPRHLHCLCVRSESERVFESRVEGKRCRFSRRVSSTISDNDERFYGFRAEDIVLRGAVADSDFDVNEVSSVHSSDWSKWEQWWFGRRYRDRNGWSRRKRPIDGRFTVRNRRKN